METRICVDTDILVDFLRNKPDAVQWITTRERAALLATTFVNLFELFYGAYKSAAQRTNVQAVEQLTQRLLILNLSHESVRRAGEQLARLEREGQRIEFRDVLIGTVAAAEGFALKTKNRKHFSKISELVLAE